MSTSTAPPAVGPIRAIFFDYMGTCLDWHSTVTARLPRSVPAPQRSPLALAWRQQYFVESAARRKTGLGVEDVDATFRRALDAVLAPDGGEFGTLAAHFGEEERRRAVAAWHEQRAWPEVAGALRAVRDALPGCELVVHANGSTRLQLDITRAAALDFDLLMSAELLGVYLPERAAYDKALRLLRLDSSQVVKVAAHAYDLRGAKEAGMKTIYIRRWTDDLDENMETVGEEFDAVLDDMTNLATTIKSL